MAESGQKKSVLFICLGNICRSPIAEAVFIDLLEEKGRRDEWLVDSAAIGPWHVGGPPDKRTMRTLKKKSEEKKSKLNYKHTVRQITEEDFHNFDVIFGMDEENMSDLEGQQPKGSKAVLEMLGKYDPTGKVVIKDPYYEPGIGVAVQETMSHRSDRNRGPKEKQGSRIEDFEDVYDQCIRCCEGYLKSFEKKS